MRRRKMFVVLVVAMLFFTTIAVSPALCDKGPGNELPSDDDFRGFLEEDSFGGDGGTCGGGDHPGPSTPQ